MPISRVGSASAEATTVTIPTGHRIGDLLIIFAFRDGSATNPTVPAGWTTLTNTTDGTSASVSLGYKIATSTSETSGTWTNTTHLQCIVYSGQRQSGQPVGTFVAAAGTTSPSTYSAVTLKNNSASWICAFQGHVSVDTTTLSTPPTGMINLQNLAGATSDSVSFDTNGPYTTTTSYAANTVAPGGTAASWQTIMLEILPVEFGTVNFQFARSVSAGIISVTEKIR